MSSFDGQTDLRQNSRQMMPQAVALQITAMGLLSLFMVVFFNFVRTKNKVIYEPKVRYHEGNKSPPRASDSLLGWVPPLLYTSELELLDKIGLDAVTFLRFQRLLRWLFTGTAALAGCILIPINVSFNHKFVDPKRRDILSILTIRDVTGNFLYAHVVVTYLITVLVIYCVNIHWREMVKLRSAWFRSPEYLHSFYARTLQVRHVPKKDQSDDGLKSIFESLNVPYPITNVHIGRKVGKLQDLIDKHNKTVREFEEILVKYLKGGRIKPNRPTIRIGGFCGCRGERKDAIEFYTAKLKETERAIEEYRKEIDIRKAENYGFASMATVPFAHVVANIIKGKRPKGTVITLAPNPKDIIWTNMAKSNAELAGIRLFGFLCLFIICIISTAPIFVTSTLANMDSIKAYIPPLKRWYDSSPSSFALVSGVLPASMSGFFSYFLPIIMRWVTKHTGALRRSKLDRAVIAKYFTFLVITQLLIFTLINVVFNSIQQIALQIGKNFTFRQIIKNLGGLPAVINRTYIDQASYWLTYFPYVHDLHLYWYWSKFASLRGFVAVFDLALMVDYFWIYIKARLFGRTPRDIREWTKPQNFRYDVYYANFLFMAAVGFVFAPLAPLIAIAAAIVFWMNSCVYKYQLMFVFVSKAENGGRIWNVVINRLLFGVLLMQALMVLTIGLQFGFLTFIWYSVIPPFLLIIIFKVYINRTYIPAFKYFTPTEKEIRAAKVYSMQEDTQNHNLEKRFGHPAFTAELFTPMLHKNLMPLLSKVYHGKINNDHAKMDEYGGQKMEAQVVPGGLKIASIDQNDLMYHPLLYQRDQGESQVDWDPRSMALTSLDEASRAQYASSSYLAGYYANLNRSPNDSSQQDIELSQMDPMREPLLRPTSALQQQEYPPSLNDHDNTSNEDHEDLIQVQPAQERTRSYSPILTHKYNTSDASSSALLLPSQQQTFEPIPHRRQDSGSSLALPQRSQSPGYSSRRHIRQNSGGNLLTSSQLRSQMSSPSPPHYSQVPREQPSGPRIRMEQSRWQPGRSDDSNVA